MELLEWHLTAWKVNSKGGWRQQPIILIEGREPFFADHPDDYIRKLEEMHDDPLIARGTFYTLIGQFKDTIDLTWLKGDGNETGTD